MSCIDRLSAADPALPGTFGDPVDAVLAEPAIATASGIPIDGLAIRGATPAEAKILIDGFEVPTLWHFGFRAIASELAIDNVKLTPGGFDVEHGRATSGILELTTRRAETLAGELSTFDGTVARAVHVDTSAYTAVMRLSDLQLWVPSLAGSNVTHGPRYFDGLVRIDHMLDRVAVTGTIVFSADQLQLRDRLSFATEQTLVRAIATASTIDGPWRYGAAISTMVFDRELERGLVQHDRDREWTFDARASANRPIGWVAGLSSFAVRFGGDANVARHDIDVAMPVQPRENVPGTTTPDGLDGVDTRHRFAGVVWTPDLGVWGALEGNLSHPIHATLGVRVDAFGPGGQDLATQPRAELRFDLAPHTTATLSGGAFRRPAEDREELEHPELHPERATQVVAEVIRSSGEHTQLRGSAYYIDRTHLIERGVDNVLRNTGGGTSVGVEVVYANRSGPWFTRVAAGLGHAVVQESPTRIERPAQYDQPVHVDATLEWRNGAWVIGARIELRSGLPVTPVQGAIYDSDRDRYEPSYGRLYAERPPYHGQLDVRVDHVWRRGTALIDAYIDIANVLDDRSAAGYVYDYDFMQKAALESLPILPMVGIKAML